MEGEMQVERAQTSSVTSSDLNMSFESVNVNSFSICLHFICRADGSVDSQFVNAQDTLTLGECLTIVQDKTVRALIKPEFKRTLNGDPLPLETLVQDIVGAIDTDLFIFFDRVEPIVKEVEKSIHYQSINKYYYLDEKKYVKVYLQLEGIGQVLPQHIQSRFLQRSFQIKIHGYNGKNWLFAVPKTQCQILTKECKVIQKDNKMIIRLGKMAENDNWFSLHRIRCVGEKELD